MLAPVIIVSLIVLGESGQASAADRMVASALAWKASLSDEQRSRGCLAYEDPKRLDWHWIPKLTRKGVMLREMNSKQKEAALELLQAALSDDGFRKAQSIMALESVLKVLEKDTRGMREPEKYYVTLFGEPSSRGLWGYSVEGHHLSINVTVKDGQVVAAEPSFFGANPRLMPVSLDVGPKKGTRTLDAEERGAFALLESLSEDQRKKAIQAKLPGYMVTGPPPRMTIEQPIGLPASEMTAAQKIQLRRLIATYAGQLNKESADRRLKGIDQAGFDAVRFAWFGPATLDQPHFFRVQGPTFILELDNTQADPLGHPANHIHSVWRSPRADFGMIPE